MLIAFDNVPSKQIQEPLQRATFQLLVRRRRFFFFLKISLLEMLIAFGNEHLKIPTNQQTSPPYVFKKNENS